MIAWTLVHAIFAALIRSDARQAATSPAKNKIVWEHSPTRIKWRDRTCLNRGVASPINCPHVSSISSTRGAPHGRPRGAMGRVATCHVAAPPLICAPLSHARATRGSATWPQRLVAPTGWSHAPRVGAPAFPLATSAPAGKKPFFVILNRKNS